MEVADTQIDRRHHPLNLNGNDGVCDEIRQQGDDAATMSGSCIVSVIIAKACFLDEAQEAVRQSSPLLL